MVWYYRDALYVLLFAGVFGVLRALIEWFERSWPPDDVYFATPEPGPPLMSDEDYERRFGVPARPYDREVDGG